MSDSRSTLFQSLYAQYQSMVLTLCRGFMKGDVELANDLTQEVFINVWNALPSFRGQSSYKTWIYRIAVNTCLLQLRKEKGKTKVTLTEGIPGDTNEQSHEPEQRLYRAIGKLEEVDRLMIMLVLDELTYGEIAEMMGISENNLRVKIHRARMKLKTLLQHEQ